MSVLQVTVMTACLIFIIYFLIDTIRSPSSDRGEKIALTVVSILIFLGVAFGLPL